MNAQCWTHAMYLPLVEMGSDCVPRKPDRRLRSRSGFQSIGPTKLKQELYEHDCVSGLDRAKVPQHFWQLLGAAIISPEGDPLLRPP